MWLLRKRSPGDSLGLPTKVFVSHAYADTQARQQLLKALPKQVRPFIFRPISVSPQQMVSTNLIKAILDCPGLVYLKGGASASSFWVAFERDYALRSGKQVYSFDPTTGVLEPDVSQPLKLPVYIVYSNRDKQAVNAITEFLNTKRFFDVSKDIDSFTDADDLQDQISGQIRRQLSTGGYTLLFWSNSMRFDDPNSVNRLEYELSQREHDDRVLPILLDSRPLPEGASSELAVHVVEGTARRQRLSWNRIDDIIVRLYWLIYRNTRQNQLS